MKQIINFGKYRGKGKTYAEVMETDRQWLSWILLNTKIPLPYEVVIALRSQNSVSLDPSVPLTDQQRTAAEAIIAGKNVVVIGPAGTGKTQILRSIMGDAAARIAPTGIAALNIAGVTFHSIFKIDPNDPLMKVGKPLDGSIKVAMFDECFYSSASLLFRALESIQKNHVGPISYLFMGDPMQLKPVHSRTDDKDLLELDEDEKEIVGDLDAWKGSTLFDVLDHFGIRTERFILTKSIRHEDEKTFSIMMGARTGTLTPEQIKELNDRVTNNPPEDAFALVPTNLIRKRLNYEYLTKFTDLQSFPALRSVSIAAPGSTDEARLDAYLVKNPKMDFLRGKLRRSGFKFKPEQFAVGCKIMITKNDSSLKIVNGDMGHITKIEDHAITCHIDRLKKELEIKRIFNGFRTRDKAVSIGLLVYPLRVAAAATIHKTQGITVYGPLHIHITPEMRKQTGLLYTAITRVRTLEQLTFSSPVTNKHFCYDKRWNEILLDMAK